MNNMERNPYGYIRNSLIWPDLYKADFEALIEVEQLRRYYLKIIMTR